MDRCACPCSVLREGDITPGGSSPGEREGGEGEEAGRERGATVWSHGENKLIFQNVAIILGSPLGGTPAS